ncbi:MAG: radical SAM family heme chaperone HemW [Defluviitaleaceae bacterium]|nr:radical SAM family heme chaperone HemW [Defluviitaleaceae bacterium]
MKDIKKDTKKDIKYIGVYIHIPFCKARCGYCDFLTFACSNHYYEPYKNALLREIDNCEILADYKITSIFIGGGTPTVLPPNFIGEILQAMGKYNIEADAEITIEANPATLSLKMLRTLKNNGVNRLSIGLQTWRNPLLKKIGRNHTCQDFLKNYNHARQLGFKNINVDVIFSLPHTKSNKYWSETVRNVAKLSPEHISAYSLSIEENTPFFNENICQSSEEDDRQMYHFAINYLTKKGYNHYEISNFAKPGKECCHSLLYWHRGEYVGLGLGASGFINGKRTKNITNIKKYMRGENIPNYYDITKKDAMSEFMYLGLRCIDGIDPKEFEKNFKTPLEQVFGEELKKNFNKGLLCEKHDKIALSKQGLNISNTVMADFLL